MERYEMAELLNEKAGVSYEEAREALEESGWDMLQAMVALEQQGKLRREGEATRAARHDSKPKKAEPGIIVRGINWLTGLIDKGNHSLFIIKKNGAEISRMSVTVFAVLMLLFHGLGLFLMLLGLLFGCQYDFIGARQIQEAGQAAQEAETAADELKNWHTVNSLNV